MEFNLSFSFGKKKDKRNVKILPPPPGITARQSVGEDTLASLGGLIGGMTGGAGTRAPRGRNMARKDPDLAYSLHVWTRVAVNKIAKAVAAHPISIESVDPKRKGKFKKVMSTMRKVLYNPNVMDGYQDYTAALVRDLMLKSAAASEMTHWITDDEPAEFFNVPVNSINVNIKGGRVDPDKAYTQIVGGEPRRTFSVKDMLYFRYLPDSGHFIPETVVANLNRILQQDGYAEKFNLDSLQNGNLVRQVIALGDKENPIDPEYVAKTQQEWDEKHKGGRTNRRVTFVAGQTINAIELDRTMGDMQWSNMQKFVVRAVAAIWDVPLIYFSYPDDTKFSNAEFEEKRFAVQTVYPVTIAICDKLNQFWVPQFDVDPQEDVHCVPSPKLMAITELDLQREEHDIKSGIITTNEVRERRGDKPSEWGSHYIFTGKEFVKFPTKDDIKRDEEEAKKPKPPPTTPGAPMPPGDGQPPATPAPAKPVAAPAAPATPPPAGQAPQVKPGGKKAISRYSDRRFRARRLFNRGLAKAIDNMRTALQIAIERAVSQFVLKLKQVQQADIDDLRRLLEADPVPLTEMDVLKSIDFMDDLDAVLLDTEVQVILTKGIEAAYKVGVGEGRVLLGDLVAAFDHVPQDILDTMSAEFINVSEKLQFAVNRTAKDLVMDGVRAGKNVNQIAKEVRQGVIGGVREDGRIVFHDGTGVKRAYSMTPERWSEVTAQTNLTKAANSARITTWRRAGVAKKQWFDMGDDRVRIAHRENTAQGPIAIDVPFGNGNMFPGEDPGCRCEIEIPDSEMKRLGA